MMILYALVKQAVQVFEGYSKWIFDLIRHRQSKTYKQRYMICSECDNNKRGICNICGCIIKAKVRVDFDLDEDGISIDGCPKKKW